MIKNKKQAIENTGWSLLQQIFNIIITLVLGPLTARYLLPDNYGLINYSATLILFFSALSEMGFNSILVKELVLNSEKEGEIIGTALFMRGAAAVIGIVGTVFVASALEPNQNVLRIVVLLQSISLLFKTCEVFHLWFQACMKVKYTAIILMASKVISIAYLMCILMLKASVYWFAFETTFTALITFGITIGVIYSKKNIVLRISLDVAKNLFTQGRHFIISGLAIVSYMQIDKLMIGKMLNKSCVGIYSVAVSISMVWQFVPLSIINTCRPLIIAKKKNNEGEYLVAYRTSLLVVSTVSLFASGIISVFAKEIVELLYGDEYLSASIPLILLVWASFLSMIGCMRGVWLVAEGLYKYDKYFAVMTAILNIVLNYIFINKWGITGAALSTLISYFYEVFVAPLFYQQTKTFLNIYICSFREFEGMLKYIKLYCKEALRE